MRLIRAFIFTAAFVSGSAFAAQKANVLVMGDGAAVPGRDTVVVARDTPVFKTVLETLSEELAREGFAVYDERAVTLDRFKQDRRGRGEAELIDIARTINSPAMDAVLIFTVTAGARELAYTTNVSTRVTARLINARTGQKIAAVEAALSPGAKAPSGCTGNCLISHIGANARDLASEFGAELALKLAAATPSQETLVAALAPTPLKASPPGYKLVFAGFTIDDLAGVEEYLVAFKGYRTHRTLAAGGEGAAYWYESDGGRANLEHNLRMMVERLGATAEIAASSADNTITLTKNPTR